MHIWHLGESVLYRCNIPDTLQKSLWLVTVASYHISHMARKTRPRDSKMGIPNGVCENNYCNICKKKKKNAALLAGIVGG